MNAPELLTKRSTLTARLGGAESFDADGKPRPEALAALVAALLSHVTEATGHTPRHESIVLVSSTPEPATDTVAVVLAWSPLPDVVYLVGGPLDGDRVNLPRDPWEKMHDPAEFVHLELPPIPFVFRKDTERIPSPNMPPAEYARAGIDPTRDAWVYHHRPTKKRNPST